MTSFSAFFCLFFPKNLLLACLSDFMNAFFLFLSLDPYASFVNDISFVHFDLTYVYFETESSFKICTEKIHDCTVSVVLALDDDKSNRLLDSGKHAAAAASCVSRVYMI